MLPVIIGQHDIGPARFVFSFLDKDGNLPAASPDRTAQVAFMAPGATEPGTAVESLEQKTVLADIPVPEFAPQEEPVSRSFVNQERVLRGDTVAYRAAEAAALRNDPRPADFHAEALAAGCNDYVTKPIDFDQLVQLLDRMTAKQ